MEDPPMDVGTIYANMNDFRRAVKQHAIKNQFELVIEKSCPNLFRGFCKAEGCPWSIIVRFMKVEKHVKVTSNKDKHFCSSTGRVRTKMASYHWVGEKAIPFLKKDPNMGAKKLQNELQDKYVTTIHYSTIYAGLQIAREKLYGTWEDSFENLFNFKAMVELKMPGSVIEIGLKETEDGVYFQRFFCCFKPSINGFLNGCRPYLSVDATALNGRWNGQLASATAIDGHNWMFPVAFGLFESETNEDWIWFMEQLRRAIGSPPHLAICSDACKGLENAVKAVFPLAEHRECFIHLMKNFSKRFQGPIFGRMYPAARTFCPIYHEHLMHKMYEANDRVQPFLETYHKQLWMRSKFSEDIKCDYITNNIAEVWNRWVKDYKDLPIAELVDCLRSKFMELYARRRDIGERLEGHTMLPIVVRHLNVLSRKLGHLKVKVGGMGEAEVTEITDKHKVIRHVVNLEQHTCSCREWEISGKPCPHALAVITSHRNPKMEDYLHPYFSVRLFRLAYAGVISPFPDKSQWPSMNLGFKVLPPLAKRAPGRPRKNRIPGCLESKGNKSRTKGMWQVQCKRCKEFGHRDSSAKCVFNGTKKRKSRAKGRPLGGMRGSTCQKQGAVAVEEPTSIL
ncbi:uncharacterized protein LOC125194687 [Salvia hispanica]|uniref:uncharacterized protein LOC125194687 n=1 Tax=Salvia hispanica TaxID=49212 RepID=UPI002009526E|nr:uncharacterized protein LOC125194687 [Salvia hispanica]